MYTAMYTPHAHDHELGVQLSERAYYSHVRHTLLLCTLLTSLVTSVQLSGRGLFGACAHSLGARSRYEAKGTRSGNETTAHT